MAWSRAEQKHLSVARVYVDRRGQKDHQGSGRGAVSLGQGAGLADVIAFGILCVHSLLDPLVTLLIANVTTSFSCLNALQDPRPSE